MPFSIQSVIMAVAFAPNPASFNNISLVRIGAHFMEDHQECRLEQIIIYQCMNFHVHKDVCSA